MTRFSHRPGGPGTCCAAEDDLESLTLLPPPLECQDYRCKTCATMQLIDILNLKRINIRMIACDQEVSQVEGIIDKHKLAITS